jgi:hypothetical protein
MKCATCRVPLYTYAIECDQCHRQVFPTMADRPRRYTCRLCLSGASEGRRASGRKGGEAVARQKRQQAGKK